MATQNVKTRKMVLHSVLWLGLPQILAKKFQRRRAVWTCEVGTGHLVHDSTTDSEYAPPMYSSQRIKKSLAVKIILDSLQDSSDIC